MKPGDAIMAFNRMGFQVALESDEVVPRWTGSHDKPEPNKVSPLLKTLKDHKREVLGFCAVTAPPAAGAFGTFPNLKEVCLGCYYKTLRDLNPGLTLKH